MSHGPGLHRAGAISSAASLDRPQKLLAGPSRYRQLLDHGDGVDYEAKLEVFRVALGRQA